MSSFFGSFWGSTDGTTVEITDQDRAAIALEVVAALTANAAGVSDGLAGVDDISITEGDWSQFSITGLGALSSTTEVIFAVKSLNDQDQSDGNAIIFLTESGGLVKIAGQDPTSSDDGLLEITDQAAGDIRITLLPRATDLLLGGSYSFAVKVVRGSGVTAQQIRLGVFNIAEGLIEQFE